ncbi:hypothetical protein KFK09_021204 [Dendrobium nobile]|uniref:Uncharacterized protein n=1 Tax=Dendrobium nobile TaxID=94219 RepID=A0A8T3ANS2_DENNO|nr:hypothetical protein KFK09_021204 [Dendrobium nobile]
MLPSSYSTFLYLCFKGERSRERKYREGRSSIFAEEIKTVTESNMEMRDEKLGYVNHLMLLLQAMVFLLCIGLLLSFFEDGGSLMVVPPPRSSPVRLESPPVELSSGRHNARLAMDLIYASKRKVPKGPDPIHNRRAGKSGRLPGQA